MPDVIVKVGGGLLASIEELDRVLVGIGELAQRCRTLVIPGGGPFADEVRRQDARLRLPDDAAHWMAVLAMDQYAHVLAARLAHGAVVSTLDDARGQLDRNSVPVLAPSRWMQEADPLPHRWDVTSDSIAAWVAVQTTATALVLIKPRGATGHLVDDYFPRVVPSRLTPIIVTADDAPAALARIASD